MKGDKTSATPHRKESHMNTTQLKQALLDGSYDERLTYIYGADALDAQKTRYAQAIDEFAALYGNDRDVALYSVAGRSELSGNHTDHNYGCVIAASIDLDIIAVAAPRNDNTVRVKSAGFPEDIVDLDVFTEPRTDRFDRSDALIAGVAAGFKTVGSHTVN